MDDFQQEKNHSGIFKNWAEWANDPKVQIAVKITTMTTIHQNDFKIRFVNIKVYSLINFKIKMSTTNIRQNHGIHLVSISFKTCLSILMNRSSIFDRAFIVKYGRLCYFSSLSYLNILFRYVSLRTIEFGSLITLLSISY